MQCSLLQCIVFLCSIPAKSSCDQAFSIYIYNYLPQITKSKLQENLHWANNYGLKWRIIFRDDNNLNLKREADGVRKQIDSRSCILIKRESFTVAYWKMNKRRVRVNICITKKSPILNSLKICEKNLF